MFGRLYHRVCLHTTIKRSSITVFHRNVADYAHAVFRFFNTKALYYRGKARSGMGAKESKDIAYENDVKALGDFEKALTLDTGKKFAAAISNNTIFCLEEVCLVQRPSVLFGNFLGRGLARLTLPLRFFGKKFSALLSLRFFLQEIAAAIT